MRLDDISLHHSVNLVGGPSNGTKINLTGHALPPYVDIAARIKPMTRCMQKGDAAVPEQMLEMPIHRYNLKFTDQDTPFYLYAG